jgi:hypothetical protein
MKNKKKFFEQKGSILVYSLIIIILMTIIIASVSFAVLSEKKEASSTELTVQALQTADNGVEYAESRLGTPPDSTRIGDLFVGTSSCNDNGNTLAVVSKDYGDGRKWMVSFRDQNNRYINDCSDTIGEILIIKSTGTYRGTARAVEVELDKNVTP